MKSYEVYLKSTPELNILRLMGLFDRPAEKGALDSLREGPTIEGLTDALQNLSDANWKYAVNNLRNMRLLAQENANEPDTVDCHPLLREYFGEKLKIDNLEAWQKGHSRLFEYFVLSADVLPKTVEKMAPLYAAVMHGCRAKRYQDVYDRIYWQRIRRGQTAYNVKKLGSISDDLVALSNFFEIAWDQPVAMLPIGNEGLIYNDVGFDLRALGRLADAVRPFQRALKIAIQIALEFKTNPNHWNQAARYANNLSDLYITKGDLSQAETYAKQSMTFADRSGDIYIRIASLVRYADCLHQAGRVAGAETVFSDAEIMQKQYEPEHPYLYSVQGFLY